MKCYYEGTGCRKGRCLGTREVDPCVGYERCEMFKPDKTFKPDHLTNADRIRAMSDEELANFLAAKFSDLQQAQQFFNESSTLTATELYALSHSWYCALMQWLRQPVKDGEG